MDDTGIVTCGTEEGYDEEVGLEGDVEIIPEVARVIQGQGWCSRGILFSSIPEMVHGASPGDRNLLPLLHSNWNHTWCSARASSERGEGDRGA